MSIAIKMINDLNNANYARNVNCESRETHENSGRNETHEKGQTANLLMLALILATRFAIVQSASHKISYETLIGSHWPPLLQLIIMQMQQEILISSCDNY